MSNKDSELRDKITALVFEWHQEVSKLPRGETISFYKDKEVMELIAAYSHQRELEAREDLASFRNTTYYTGNDPELMVIKDEDSV